MMRQIESVSEDIKEQLLNWITCSQKFALELDESPNLADVSRPLVLVRYCYEENIHKDFIFCPVLMEGTTGSDMFTAVNDCVT
jgi:hypothetical protein